MSPNAKDMLRHVEFWPEEDQEELADVAREIEARRSGIYVLNEEERSAIEDAKKSGLVSDNEMKAFWTRHGIA